ncbi:hypothetical protein AGMMS49525_09720 [Bacteroidia bacterium]|nr:hypothetical protein AGMMS49525_09720 [Bacteroidia bacterium]
MYVGGDFTKQSFDSLRGKETEQLSASMAERKFCNFIYKNTKLGTGCKLRKEKEDGYTTEKMIDPLVSNSVPIYWGNEKAKTVFNPAAFVNANDFLPDMDALVRRVIELGNDYKQYMAMLRANPVLSDSAFDFDKDQKLSTFLMNIFENGQKYTDKGRIDAVWTWQERVVIAEVKYAAKGAPNKLLDEALAQIHKCHYSERYAGENKRIALLGVAFAGKEIACRMEELP